IVHASMVDAKPAKRAPDEVEMKVDDAAEAHGGGGREGSRRRRVGRSRVEIAGHGYAGWNRVRRRGHASSYGGGPEHGSIAKMVAFASADHGNFTPTPPPAIQLTGGA